MTTNTAPLTVPYLTFVRAMSTALAFAKDEADANPDVGMGPWPETLLDRVTQRGSIQLTLQQSADILADYRLRFQR